MVERYNRTLEHQITMFVNDNQKDWDQHISLLLMAYRTATHESTGLTPAKMMMGRELRVPLDLLMGTPPESNQTSKPSYVEKLKESLRDSLCKNLMTSLDQETDSSQTLSVRLLL